MDTKITINSNGNQITYYKKDLDKISSNINNLIKLKQLQLLHVNITSQIDIIVSEIDALKMKFNLNNKKIRERKMNKKKNIF